MSNICLAFLLDHLLGDPPFMPHPVRLMGAYISFFERHMNRTEKSEAYKKIAGVLLLISTIVSAYLLTWFVLRLAAVISPYLYRFLNIYLMYTCIAARCLSNEGKRIYHALCSKDLENGRRLLSMIVGRDTASLDEGEIARGAVETVAENTSDGVIAPLLYMSLGGAPLAMAYKAVNTLDSMVGYKNDRYLSFGWASARFDDIVNYIPARLTGVLMVAASALLGLDFRRSFGTLVRDGRRHSSPNSGFPEAATAGALGVRLGGTNYYFGKPVDKPTIGEPLRPLEGKDIIMTVRLMYISSIMSIALLILLRGLE